jgi:hypothetical protein
MFHGRLPQVAPPRFDYVTACMRVKRRGRGGGLSLATGLEHPIYPFVPAKAGTQCAVSARLNR